ncbi:Ankyrin repeat and FYVE domain-containing protein 1 [Phlyctochytrium planicorne]|nr:Ankyrin repeat and FYVE domain-containing protein 1 [Phlyctochytrium planicorne]
MADPISEEAVASRKGLGSLASNTGLYSLFPFLFGSSSSANSATRKRPSVDHAAVMPPAFVSDNASSTSNTPKQPETNDLDKEKLALATRIVELEEKRFALMERLLEEIKSSGTPPAAFIMSGYMPSVASNANSAVQSLPRAPPSTTIPPASSQPQAPAVNQQAQSTTHPSRKVFESYCWLNSRKHMERQVALGVATSEDLEKAGQCDPREVYNWIQSAGMNPWLDVVELGDGEPLYGQLVDALKSASVVVAFISDQYSRSRNCLKEWAFASKLGLPVVPVIVGELPKPGEKPEWLLSEIGFDMGNVLYIDARNPDDQERVQIQIRDALSRHLSRLEAASSSSEPVDLFTAVRNSNINACRKILSAVQNPADRKQLCDKQDPFDLKTALHFAVESKRTDIVLMLVENGATISIKDATGATPLYIACSKGLLSMVEALLKLDAHDPAVSDNRNRENRAPLHACTGGDHADVAKALIASQGAGVLDVVDENLFTPLHFCARSGSVEVAKVLIAEGAKLESRDWFGRTPLHIAALSGQAKIVTVLIDAGSDMNALSQDKDTPIILAVTKGDLEVAKVLLERGADFNTPVSSWSKAMPIIIATEDGNKDMVELLIKYGANLELYHGRFSTPICLAAGNGNKEIVQMLLDAGANINHHPTFRDQVGYNPTALGAAAYHGHTEVCKILLKHKPNLELATTEGYTPLLSAAEYGHGEIVDMLLQVGANSKAVTKNGSTLPVLLASSGLVEPLLQILDLEPALLNQIIKPPGTTLLHTAARRYEVKMVKALISRGADVNLLDSDGNSVLISLASAWAREEKNIQSLLETAGILIDARCKVNEVMASGETPLSTALRNGQDRTCMLLIERGADVAFVDKDGKNVFTLALNGNCTQVIGYLLNQNLAHANALDEHGAAPLLRVAGAYTVDPELIKTLIESGAKVNAVTGTKNYEETALHASCKRLGKTVKPIETLLSFGADPNIKNSSGQTALHVACKGDGYNPKNGEIITKVVEILLKAGADPNLTDNDGLRPIDVILTVDRWRRSQITSDERADIVAALLKFGVDANHKGGKNELPILSSAVELNLYTVAKSLVDSPNISLSATNVDGLTPLHHAAKSCNPKMIELLFSKPDQKPDPNARALDGETALGCIPLRKDYSRMDDNWSVPNALECFKLLADYGASCKIPKANGYTVLHSVASGNDFGPILDFLIRNGADPNARRIDGSTPLHDSAERSQAPASVQALIDAGSDIWAADERRQQTSLHVAACGWGGTPIVELLVKAAGERKREYVNCKDWLGRTALNIAASLKRMFTVKVLVEAGVELEVVDTIPDGFERSNDTAFNFADKDIPRNLTALLSAAREGGTEVVEYLVANGANIYARAHGGYNILHLAAIGGLTNFFSSINDKLDGWDQGLEACTEEGWTPALCACRGGQIETFRALVEVHGANKHVKDKKGRNPLHIAAIHRKLDMVNALIEMMPELVNQADDEGFTPAMSCLLTETDSDDRTGVVRALISAGADIHYTLGTGETLLWLALKGKFWELAEELLDLGVDHQVVGPQGVTCAMLATGRTDPFEKILAKITNDEHLNLRDESGRSLLHYAASENEAALLVGVRDVDLDAVDSNGVAPIHLGSLAVLMDAGARTDITSLDGRTMLHWAAVQSFGTSKNRNAFEALLQASSNSQVNAQDSQLQTPLHLAAGQYDLECLRMLVKAGADLEAKDVDGLTPLHHALKCRHADEAKVLVELGSQLTADMVHSLLEDKENVKYNFNLLMALRKAKNPLTPDQRADFIQKANESGASDLAFALERLWL